MSLVHARLKKNSLRSPPVPRYNIRKLQNPAFQQCFAVEVSNRFSALSEDERDDWSVFKAELNSVAKTTLGIHCKGVRCPPIFSLSNLIDAGWL